MDGWMVCKVMMGRWMIRCVVWMWMDGWMARCGSGWMVRCGCVWIARYGCLGGVVKMWIK